MVRANDGMEGGTKVRAGFALRGIVITRRRVSVCSESQNHQGKTDDNSFQRKESSTKRVKSDPSGTVLPLAEG